MIKKVDYDRNLVRDFILLGLSIVFTVFLVRFGILESILSVSHGWSILSSFVAGFFFTSVFTISPASIAIAHLSHGIDSVTLAAWGAFGAMLGDIIIFAFLYLLIPLHTRHQHKPTLFLDLVHFSSHKK